MTESERKEFKLLENRVLALEDRLERFEQCGGWKEQGKPSEDETKVYIFDAVVKKVEFERESEETEKKMKYWGMTNGKYHSGLDK